MLITLKGVQFSCLNKYNVFIIPDCFLYYAMCFYALFARCVPGERSVSVQQQRPWSSVSLSPSNPQHQHPPQDRDTVGERHTSSAFHVRGYGNVVEQMSPCFPAVIPQRLHYLVFLFSPYIQQFSSSIVQKSDCVSLFPESTTESLDKKQWEEKLLKVCLSSVSENIISFQHNVIVLHI